MNKTIMRSSFIGGLFASLLLLSGCSMIQVSQDYDPKADFTQLHSYQWLPADMQTKPKATDFEKTNPLIAKRIETALVHELNLKGQSIVDKGADAYITYHISSVSKIRSSPVTTSIGFGSGLGGGVYTGFGFQTGSDVEQYQEGQLVVDILSLKGQLLWRGTSSTPLEDHSTPEETTKLVNEIVQKLMAQYPPKK
ncbi:DUF4136 domain-containing protein [Hydrogenovibrio sp. JE_KL2]|uniref:DUF4136 domain-containing protein n=1 Tax=Hydrogenovibrio sp. JE_KL2 TaxID=2651188 RepID=UPI00128DA974|nr:DUF4136 domain-containing protein [Hydrogenovibrio sp. JE_KL2]MPQ76872.1 DUF4136 domain-containing protein [Hydrogenovibrio sp. JE_KL2]